MAEIFSLADWITSRRVAVTYRKFLKSMDQTIRFRKIPTPSETRWLFYRDVVNIILDQFDQIVLFVSQTNQLFSQTRLTYRPSLSNSIKRALSSPHGFFRNLLLFAKYLLDVLGKENTVMQGKLTLFTDLWECVCQLKGELSNCLDALVNNDFTRLGIVSPSPTEKEMFIAAIRATMKNMAVRFPCPSSSLNKRQLQNRDSCLDVSMDMHALARAYSSCPLRVLFNIYSFPDEFLRHSTIKEHLLSELNGEVRQLSIKMSGMREETLTLQRPINKHLHIFRQSHSPNLSRRGLPSHQSFRLPPALEMRFGSPIHQPHNCKL